MESLTNILERLEPQLEPRASLAGPVLAKIAARRRRARRLRLGLLVALNASLLAVLVALVRGRSLEVVRLAFTHQAAVTSHLSLYLRALFEVVPVVPIVTLLAGLGCIWLLRRLEHHAARVAPWLTAASVGLAITGASTSAYAATTASPTAGPAQQEFERVINKVGVPSVTIDGKTYQLVGSGNMTDTQLAAAVETFKLHQQTNALDLAHTPLDNGSYSCDCRVVAMTSTSIAVDYWLQFAGSEPYLPGPLAIDADTKFFDGAKPVAPFTLKPGDLVVISPRSGLKAAAYIARTSFSYEDLTTDTAIWETLPKHNDSGLCYNYEEAKCPDLTSAVRQVYSYLPSESSIPAGARIREVFGVVQTLSGTQRFTLKDSTGSIWTVVLGSAFGGSVQPGDGVRIEFWQMVDRAQERTIIDETGLMTEQYGTLTKTQAMQLIAQGKLSENPSIQIRGMQVILPQ